MKKKKNETLHLQTIEVIVLIENVEISCMDL